MEKDGHVTVATFKRKREWIIDRSTSNQYLPTRVPCMVTSARERLNNFFPKLSNLLEEKKIVQISHPRFVVKNGDNIYPIKYLRFWGFRATRIIWHEVNVGNQPVNGSPAPGSGTIQILDDTYRVIQDLSEENQIILESVSELGGSVPGNVATTSSLKRYSDFNGAGQQNDDGSHRSTSTSSCDQTSHSTRTNTPSLFNHQVITPEIQLANDFFSRSFGFKPWPPPQQDTMTTLEDGSTYVSSSVSSRQSHWQIFPAHGSTNAFPIFKKPPPEYEQPRDDIVPFTSERTPQQNVSAVPTAYSTSGHRTSIPPYNPMLENLLSEPLQHTRHTRTRQGASGGFRSPIPTPTMANPLGILTPDPHHQFVSPLANLYSMAGTSEVDYYSGNYMADSSQPSTSNRKRPANDSDLTDPKRPCLPGNPPTGNFVFDTCSNNDPLFDVFDGTQHAQESQIDAWRTIANTAVPPNFGAVNQNNIRISFQAQKMPFLFSVANYGLPRQQNQGLTDTDDGEEEAPVIPPDGTLSVKVFGLEAKTGYAKNVGGNRITFTRVDTEFLSNANFINGICRVKAKWTGYILHEGPTIVVDNKYFKAPLEFKGPINLRGELIMEQEGYEEGAGQQEMPTTSTARVISEAFNGLYNN